MAPSEGALAARSGDLGLGPRRHGAHLGPHRRALTRAIREGALQPGDRLPTELELARDFGVGRTSVREGLQKLRAHGLIESRKGLGAFVAANLEPDPLADFERWAQSNPRAIEHLVEGRFALEALRPRWPRCAQRMRSWPRSSTTTSRTPGPVRATTATR